MGCGVQGGCDGVWACEDAGIRWCWDVGMQGNAGLWGKGVQRITGFREAQGCRDDGKYESRGAGCEDAGD